MFTDDQYIFLENAGTTNRVFVALDGEIARDLTIRVYGGNFILCLIE